MTEDPSSQGGGRGPDAEPLMTVDAVMEAGAARAAPAMAASDQLVAIVEALVFASPEPLTPKQLFKLLDTEPKEEVEAAVAELKRRYAERGGGLQLVEVAGG
ncbi:MAG TPA: SMC-Scp complex subunit ScpB, partial [Vicinamibacterales bacterium]|nr:SMC-Scp complex subunit ScpB [Vicinamibacterales bacterium]